MISCKVKKSAYDEYLPDKLEERVSTILGDELGNKDIAVLATEWLKLKLLQSADTLGDIQGLTSNQVAELLVRNITIESAIDKNMLIYHIGWFDDYIANIAKIVEYGTQIGDNPVAANYILIQMLLSQEEHSFMKLVEATIFVSLSNALEQVEVK